MPDFSAGEARGGAGRREHFVVGDPIRGAAALLVFTFHVALAALFVTGYQFNHTAYAQAFGSVAGEVFDDIELAVFAFFTLSGYLISRPFVAAYLRGERGPRLGNYARRRILRIVPAFLLVVSLAMIRFGAMDASPTEVLSVFTLLQAYDLTPPNLVLGVFGHLWTVQVETGFYLLLPLAMLVLAAAGRRLDAKGRLTVLLGLCAVTAAASLVFRHLAPQTVLYSRWLPGALFAFAPGIALAAIEDFARPVLRGRRGARPVVGLLLGVAVISCVAFGALQDQSPAILGAFAGLATSTFIGAALVKQWAGGGAWRLLDNRPLHWIGERSYSFYLIHVPVLWDLQFRVDGRIDDPRVAFTLLFASAFAVSAGFATLSFRYVEWPAMQRDGWPWQRRRATAAAERLPAPEPALSSDT